MQFIGTNKHGTVKIKPSSAGHFTLSLIAQNGTGWAEPAQSIAEAKAKAEQSLGKVTWQEK